jgi:hypothetical protein
MRAIFFIFVTDVRGGCSRLLFPQIDDILDRSLMLEI